MRLIYASRDHFVSLEEQSTGLLMVSVTATAVFDTDGVDSIHPLTLYGAIFSLMKKNYWGKDLV